MVPTLRTQFLGRSSSLGSRIGDLEALNVQSIALHQDFALILLDVKVALLLGLQLGSRLCID